MPDITVAGGDGEFSAYLATPAGGSGPGILCIQEIFGVNADMREHCDNFAAQGYFALSPDLFWRQEPGIQLTDKTEAEWQRAFELYQGFDVAKGMEDLIAALSHLRGIEGCTGKTGTVGYCLGGLLAYLMACQSDAECNVSYYGVGIDEKLDLASNITAPTLLHMAEEDEYVNKEAQAAINNGLAGHSSVTLYSYAGVNHAFTRNDGIHYDAGAAKLAHQRTADAFAAALR
ncbi:MAG: dienelactone hydrolase family protein [Rhodospirillaceae bacterium]|nr:dienelactone hydrolase family protein [Rhodospirillaceae bacterium]MDD9913598.1 dienelactone hydrolase family protein [Rhodospirillaceae bacterium]MDD9925410.1 dienelactone hydrolase family protein [Rhodospirillaceae bacterium]